MNDFFFRHVIIEHSLPATFQMDSIEVGSKVKADPAISIIVPNYNTEAYIAETLGSIFAQSFTDFEVIVINDASPGSARLPEALGPFRDRIVFIDKVKNEGTSASRNQAVAHARGRTISFLDADDTWFPSYLEELSSYMNAGDYDMAYTDAEAFRDGSTCAYTDFLSINPDEGPVTRKMFIDGWCHILPSGTLIKKDSLLSVGGFDVNVSRAEDFDLWMRLLFSGISMGYLKKVLFRFRISPGSGSGDSVTRIQRNRKVWRLLQKKLPFTEEENRMIEKHVVECDAAVLRAQGRVFINQKNWNSARETLIEAAKKAAELDLPLLHRLKMRMVILLLGLAPSLVGVLFRRYRSEEIPYMPREIT